MPIAPPPVTYQCSACGWSKTVAPRSDALMPGEYFSVCPGCGYAPLDTVTANVLRAAIAKMALRVRPVQR